MEIGSGGSLPPQLQAQLGPLAPQQPQPGNIQGGSNQGSGAQQRGAGGQQNQSQGGSASANAGRGLELSSNQEIEAAGARVNSALSREAPIGRTSEQQAQNRHIPLGQIVDIRV